MNSIAGGGFGPGLATDFRSIRIIDPDSGASYTRSQRSDHEAARGEQVFEIGRLTGFGVALPFDTPKLLAQKYISLKGQ